MAGLEARIPSITVVLSYYMPRNILYKKLGITILSLSRYLKDKFPKLIKAVKEITEAKSSKRRET